MRGFLARRRSPEPPPAAAPAPRPLPPIRRAPATEHHWLTVHVARPEGPVAGARVAVRPHAPDGRLLDVAARGLTRDDGTVELLLPAGRYAVSVGHRGDAKCVNVLVQRPGHANVLLDATGHRVVLTVEAPLANAAVEARFVPGGALAARSFTDDRGVAALLVPPGEVEVRVGDAVARATVAGDALVRLR